MSNDWKAIDARYIEDIKPATTAIAVKYYHAGDDMDATGLSSFGRTGTVCECLRRAIEENAGFWFAAEHNFPGFDYCSQCNGVLPITEEWECSKLMSNHPFKFFKDESVEGRAHASFQKKGVPAGGDNIIAFAPLGLGLIENPDVIVLSIKPGDAFILLSGLLYENYEELWFPFVGESNCTDMYGYTYNTGKPGMSFGCKGERLEGGMKEFEVRLSFTPEQFLKALDGFETLQANGHNYPFSEPVTYSE